ncbi:hypothetical protein HK104_010616 [Borealophlyctis nickersoniae]|nr:hypothetical protein HK104_010616 [Borealophlyctis nickersoniae]
MASGSEADLSNQELSDEEYEVSLIQHAFVSRNSERGSPRPSRRCWNWSDEGRIYESDMVLAAAEGQAATVMVFLEFEEHHEAKDEALVAAAEYQRVDVIHVLLAAGQCTPVQR